AQTPLPWWRVDLRRDTRGEDARVSRGTLSLIQAGMGGAIGVPALPTKGIAAVAAMPTLDVDAWRAALQVFKGVESSGAASSQSAAEAAESYLPESLTIKTHALVLNQRTLKDVSGTLAHPSPGVWRAQIDSQQVAGQLEWAPEAAALSAGPGSTRL